MATIDIPLPKPAWASAITTADALGPPQSIFLYGLPGTRKTTISATISQVESFKKVLFIDTDNGTTVLSLDPTFSHIEILKIDPLDPNAKAKLDGVIADVCANDYGYDAVVLDTISVAQSMVEKFLKVKYAGDKKNTFAVYGDLGEWTEDTVRRLHNAPHFTAIITCHSQEKLLESGVTKITPKLSGSSKDTIGGIPDLVAHLSYIEHPETNERHLVAIVGESDSLISKNRYRLSQSILDFTMPVLYGLINEKLSKKPAAVAPIKTTTTPVAAAA